MLNLKRDPYFYMLYYIFPSVIFVILSYCSYWISSDAVDLHPVKQVKMGDVELKNQFSLTAKCVLAITTVLFTINFQSEINSILPPTEYAIWMDSYFTGIIIFTFFTMFEYAVVNFCSSNYYVLQQEMNDRVNNLKANLSKYKKKLYKKFSK